MICIDPCIACTPGKQPNLHFPSGGPMTALLLLFSPSGIKRHSERGQQGAAELIGYVGELLAVNTDPWPPGLAHNSVDSPRLRHHQPWCLYACGGAPDFMDCFCQIGGNSWQNPPQISQILYVSVLTGTSPYRAGVYPFYSSATVLDSSRAAAIPLCRRRVYGLPQRLVRVGMTIGRQSQRSSPARCQPFAELTSTASLSCPVAMVA